MDTKYGGKFNREGTVNAIINMVSVVPNFIQQWNDINVVYENFSWKDNITDSERIQEYRKINTIYQKYISDHKNKILDKIVSPEQLLEYVSKLIKANLQKPANDWERWFIVYIELKNRWLYTLANYIAQLIEIDKTFNKTKED